MINSLTVKNSKVLLYFTAVLSSAHCCSDNGKKWADCLLIAVRSLLGVLQAAFNGELCRYSLPFPSSAHYCPDNGKKRCRLLLKAAQSYSVYFKPLSKVRCAGFCHYQLHSLSFAHSLSHSLVGSHCPG